MRLQHFPVAWFSTVMGMAGFTIAWMRAGSVLGLPAAPGATFLLVTGILFVALTLVYLTKLARFNDAVAKELRHPVKLSFFPTFSIALILLGIATLHSAPGLSFVLWAAGTGLHLLFTLYVMAVWLNHTHFQIHHMNPAWFIPVVGNILVPIAGVHHASPEIAWFFFSIGLVFWLVLLTIVYYRVIFHDPLPEKLLPTLFILVAPPAVGFISYVSLVGSVDSFARVLYYLALFLTLMLLSQVQRFARLKFFLSWWAYSFPMAAMTIATMLMYQHTALPFFAGLSYLLLALLSAIIAMLVVRTTLGVARKEICVEE